MQPQAMTAIALPMPQFVYRGFPRGANVSSLPVLYGVPLLLVLATDSVRRSRASGKPNEMQFG